MKLLTPKAIEAAMLEKLAGSLLTKADAAKLKFKPLTSQETKAMDLPAAVAGFFIPYFTIDGKPSKFWRVRYLEDTRKGFDVLNGRKALRYVQPSESMNEVYLAPYVDWRKLAENATVPIIITEGELKAACATKIGLPTIGLGGVWSFKSNKAKVSLLPALAAFLWKGRKTIICYDSDAVTNPDVVMAENALAKELLAAGAEVYIARLPAEGTAKVGLDDYLLNHQPEQLMHLIASAEEYRVGAALHHMNSEVVYVRNPGVVFVWETGQKLACHNFTAHAYANRWHDDLKSEKIKKAQTAPAWVQWPNRSELEAFTFAPGAARVHQQAVNQWSGWPLEPKKGSVTLWRRMLDWLFQGAEPEAYKWFEQWCAYPMQHPGVKMASAVLFWGRGEGTGKTMVGWTLQRIYGAYSCEVTDTEIEDERMDWAENKQFVLADDITAANSRRLANKLKTMVTQKTLKVNPKFIPRYTVPDCANYYFTSNDPDVFQMDDGNRRYFIHEVIVENIDVTFRDEFNDWKNSDAGMAALFHHLLTLDLDGFDPYAPPFRTRAKDDMIQLVKSDLGAWVADLKYNPDRNLKLPGDLFTANELLAMYDPLQSGKVTANGMARELKRAGFRPPGMNGSIALTSMGNLRLYAIRNAEPWRAKRMKQVIEHYESNRAPMEQPKLRRVKF